MSDIAANRARVRAGTLPPPSEKSPTVEDVQQEIRAGVAPPASGSATSHDVNKPEDRPKRNLADPKTQWEILSPEAMRYTLRLPGGERRIETRTAFTLADEMHRRIYENLESFRSLIGVEMSSLNPDYRPGESVDWSWVASHTQYLDSVMLLSHVRAKARDVVARVSKFVVADPDEPVERLKPEHLEDGMDHVQLVAAALAILNAATEANAARKKALAAKAAPA